MSSARHSLRTIRRSPVASSSPPAAARPRAWTPANCSAASPASNACRRLLRFRWEEANFAVVRYNFGRSAAVQSTEILRRVIERENGSFSPELARFIWDLDFRGEDHARYEELSNKAQEGTLNPSETEELDGFVFVDSILAILRLKAERSLRK